MKKYLKLIPLYLGVIICTAFISTSHADITGGLLAHYAFEGDANDSSGNGRNGAATNIAFAAGQVGQAAQFDNATSFVDVASLANNLPGANTARTVGFWVFPTTNDNGNMVSWGVGANGQRFSLLHQANRRLDIIGHFHDTASAQTLAINTWTHVTVTYDSTDLRFYINGVLVQTLAPPAAYITDATQILRMGINAVPNNNEFFGGALDEVRIYNRVLSNADVTELFNFSGPAAPAAATPIPTLSEWSFIILFGLLSISAIFGLRRS